MCDCVKIIYTPIGEEPIESNVISNGLINGRNYYEFNTPNTIGGCDTIKVTYQLVGGEFVTVEIPLIDDVYSIENFSGGNTLYIFYESGQWLVYIKNNLQAILSQDTECPFGVYTVEESSSFESFVVEPLTVNNFTVSWDGVNWNLSIGGDDIWRLSEDDDCPLGNWENINDTTFFSDFKIEECDSKKTISYSMSAEGWNSFWSYQPDWMTKMNNIFYTFKNGELWKHNANTTRNNFYGEQYPSKIRSIFNNDPLTVKMFNILSLNSSHPWSSDIYTNINAGAMDYTYFVEKENQWYAYIRRFDDTIDVKALSTQGIGVASNVQVLLDGSIITSFDFNIDSSISVGDKVYKNSSGNLILVGTITNITSNSITMNVSIGGSATTSDFLICVKNSQTESFGARGYYMNVYLSNDSTEQVKLFSIGTSVFKSFL
jgi:hypothetical protein